MVWHLNRLGITDLTKGPDPVLVVKNYAERTHTLKEMAQKSQIYYTDFEEYDKAGVKKWIKEGSVDILKAALEVLTKLDSWDSESIDKVLEQLAKDRDVGMGKVGQPLRIALTGAAMSPGIGDTMVLVGKERSLVRISRAIEHFSA